jgi:hypothetical protein
MYEVNSVRQSVPMFNLRKFWAHLDKNFVLHVYIKSCLVNLIFAREGPTDNFYFT